MYQECLEFVNSIYWIVIIDSNFVLRWSEFWFGKVYLMFYFLENLLKDSYVSFKIIHVPTVKTYIISMGFPSSSVHCHVEGKHERWFIRLVQK